MKAILGLLVMVGVGCMVMASIMAIQSTTLTAMDFFIVGFTIVVAGVGMRG